MNGLRYNRAFRVFCSRNNYHYPKTNDIYVHKS